MTRRGFSLVEYMVVLGIIALLSGVAYPTYRRWLRQATTRQTAEQLANLIRTAQERSVGEQLIYGVVIDAPNRLATLVSYGDSFAPSQTPTTVDQQTFSNQTAISEVTLIDTTTGLSEVRFTAAGAPSRTGTARVSHAFSPDVDWLVEIEPSGAVSVTSQDD